MQTLLLDLSQWDLVLDVNGNIAVASPPYAPAQDAASAMRLFLGELWYDTTQGVPYWSEIIGQAPPVALLKAKLTRAALTVPDVTAIVAAGGQVACYITSIAGRKVSGQVQITTSSGNTTAAAF